MTEYIVENINNYEKDFLLKNVSKARVEKALKCRQEGDIMRSLLVEYALNKLIKSFFPSENTPVELEYDEHGKPSLKHALNGCIHISLSHSGDYVAAMISDMPCGIDIEKTDRKIQKISQRFFTADELKTISEDADYLKIWTLKECIAKAVGKGLSLGIDSYSVAGKVCTIDGVSYECHTVEAPEGYALSYVVEIKSN